MSGRLFIFCLFSVVLLLAFPARFVVASQSIASVIDGDTIEVDGRVIGLYGIDAPELGQFCMKGKTKYRCGYDAALSLGKLLKAGPVECRPTPIDTKDDGQICAIGLVDLAEAMLQRGLAVARRNALVQYRRAELEAKRSKLGIWRGNFIQPSDWRKGHRLPHQGDETKEVCDIKGMVGDKGKRIYLVITDSIYTDFKVNPALGEKYFCSDDEAELAGWRRWPKSALQRRGTEEKQQSD